MTGQGDKVLRATSIQIMIFLPCPHTSVTPLAVAVVLKRLATSRLTCALTLGRGPTSVMSLAVAIVLHREAISRPIYALTQGRGPSPVMCLAVGTLLQ